MRTGILSLFLLTAVACSPAQRAAAGGALGAGGLAIAGESIEWMLDRPCRVHDWEHQSCAVYDEGLSPSVGIPIVLGGLEVAVLGAMLLASAGERERKPTEMPTKPEPPDEPSILGKTDAIGMAIAQLVLVGLDGSAKPSKLLNVDDAQVTVRTEERHAELWSLRVRTAPNETWRTVGACYEYEHEWRLASFGTTPGCQWREGRSPTEVPRQHAK